MAGSYLILKFWKQLLFRQHNSIAMALQYENILIEYHIKMDYTNYICFSLINMLSRAT